MCGIAGCYQQDDGRGVAATMSASIAHRGPDASGTWQLELGRLSVHLAHRRLSIIDLSSSADQPFAKDAKKSVAQVVQESGGEVTGFARFRVGA